MIIVSKEVCVMVLSGINIFPGVNEFGSEDSKKLEKDKLFEKFVESGRFDLLDVENEDSEDEDESVTLESERPIIKTVTSANIEDAKEIIEELYIVEDLEAILDAEKAGKNRKKVITAVKKQIENLTKEPEEEEEE